MKWLDNGVNNDTYGRTLVAANVISGRDEVPGACESLTSVNPSDLGDRVAIAPLSRETEVTAAVKAATQGYQVWRKVPAPVRANVFARLGQLVTTHKEALSYFVTREMGKTLKEARGEVQEVIDTCQFFQSEGRRLYGQTIPSEMRQKDLFTYRRPYGVTAIITPSNFPIAVASWKIIPALVCGNSIVWKSPPEAPGIAYLFAKLLEEAGLPPGTLNLVHGDAETGKLLLSHVDAGHIQKVSFTGSSRVGRYVGEICGRNLQTPSLELGGKNPLVVMEDADLDLAVQSALWASYGTAGQRCTSAGNIILHQPIKDTFTQRFIEGARAIKIGNPIQYPDVLYGPMIAEHYLEHFLAHETKAKTGQVTKLLGDGRIREGHIPQNFVGDPRQGLYVWPTLWDGVRIDDWIAQEEVFGPAVGLITVKDIDEAISVANGTAYGLSAAIFTRNRLWAYRYKEEVRSGMVSINNSTTGAEAHIPFGGMKASGNGTRESGIWVLDAYTQWQAVNDELSGQLQLAQMDTEQVSQGLSSLNWSGIPQRFC